MLKVLIADDEQRVSKLIEKLIDWDGLGMTLAATASTGVEAYELIEKYRPDIVITDIRMPGLDGLGVIEKVKQQGWKVDFIVVSGYKYFEYAYNALKYGVEDYLLKPIQKEELNTILGKIALARKEKEQLYQNRQQMETEREASQEILQQSFLDMLLQKKVLDVEQVQQEYHLNLDKGTWLCYALITDGDHFERGKEEAVQSFTHTLYRKMKKYFEKDQYVYQNLTGIRQVYLTGIINYDALRLDGQKALEACFEEMLKFTQNFHGYRITMAIGSPLKECGQLSEALVKTFECLEARLTMGVNRVLCKEEIEEGEEMKLSQLLKAEDLNELKNAVGAGDRPRLEFALKEFFRKLNEYKDLGYRCYYKMIFEVITLCYNTLSEQGDLDGEKEFLYQKIKQIDQKSIIRNYVIRYMTESTERFISQKKNRETKPVRQVKEYLKTHFADAIGLEEAASMVDLNPVYLSVLFKRSTGVNFNDYLTEIRIDEAKRLLRETNDTINMIAGKVGYGNGKYFSQVFSKVAGINPTVYRKLHS